MRNILKDYKIYNIDPAKLRGSEFFASTLEYRKNTMAKFQNAIKDSEKYQCPLCKNTKGENFLQYENYILFECQNCKLVSPNIQFDMLGNEDVYDDQNYVKKINDDILKTYDYRKKTFAPERLSYILEKINDIPKEKIKLLDMGCGPGYFISHLKDVGIQNKGIELSNFLVSICEDKGLNVKKANLENEPNETYNIITLYDVLEHLPDPISTFKILHEKLSSGGYVVAYTPHIHSVGFHLMQEMQNLLLPFQHLCFFDKNSLEYLAQHTKFSIHSIEFFGLDIMDYFYMKSYQDNYDYLEKCKDLIPVIQAIIDKQGLSNHMRVIFKKI